MIFVIYYKWQHWFPWFWAYFVFEFRNNIIGLPLSIPLLCSAIISRWKLPVMIWAISILALLPVLMYYRASNHTAILLNIAVLIIPVAIIVIVGIEIEWRGKQRNAEAERERERQVYMTQILKAQEDERSRIAQELHDDATQTLMVIASTARSLLSSKKQEIGSPLREHLEWTRDTALRLAEDMRRLSLDLRPSLLDTMGLVPALNWLVHSIASGHNINAQLVVEGENRKLRPEDDVTIFRIVQEALSNVRQHSQATSVCVRVEFMPELVKLSVQDDGVGFNLSESMASYSDKGKLGLIGMHQRARTLGGSLKIHTHDGRGCLISADLPV